ncbi:MAG: hypothetical protein MUF07_18805 [Steroidobacteraceae bacterium]|jgi:hypothetical protein|nr:hypothetical protein [Steroidobacteraceae bacterium]
MPPRKNHPGGATSVAAVPGTDVVVGTRARSIRGSRRKPHAAVGVPGAAAMAAGVASADGAVADAGAAAGDHAATATSRAHLRRLRQYFRSAGWPCHDNLEIDLLVAGLAERATHDAGGLETIRVTEAGLAALAGYRQQNRHALDSHDALVARIAQQLVDEGRVVFRGVALRAKVEAGWKPVRPDVFSIRNTSHDGHLAPFVHEVKVSRADLLTDLRNAGKRAGYQALSQQFWYVLAEGIAEPAEIPEDCGVIVAEPGRLRVLRPSPVRDVRLVTLHWLQLAKARAEYGPDDDGQLPL